MANVDAAFGFVPIRHMSGNIPRANKYTITSGLAENIFTGDLCILTADGVITPHTATETNNIGVFAGVSYPYIVYKVMSDGSPAQTNIGNCADVVAGAGSTTTGQSGFQLNSSMGTGTATCKIIGLYESPDNAFGANAVVEVLLNEHILKDTAGI